MKSVKPTENTSSQSIFPRKAKSSIKSMDDSLDRIDNRIVPQVKS